MQDDVVHFPDVELSLRQRIIASPHLVTVWSLAFSVVTVVVSNTLAESWAYVMTSGVIGLLWTLLISALAFVTGYIASVPVGWFVLGPIAHHQESLNGGPFEVGDTVYIIAGCHQGKVGKVYGFAQYETPRVEIGAEAREGYSDIFPGYQLVRVSGNKVDKES